MKKFYYSTRLLVLIIALSFVVSGSLTMATARSVYDVRDITRTVGNFQTGSLRRMPPLHERHVRNIALLYFPIPHVKLDPAKLGFLADEPDLVDSELFMTRAAIEEQFLNQLAAAPHIKGRLVTPEERQVAQGITFNDQQQWDITGDELCAKVGDGVKG